jgi:hypothetical protein
MPQHASNAHSRRSKSSSILCSNSQQETFPYLNKNRATRIQFCGRDYLWIGLEKSSVPFCPQNGYELGLPPTTARFIDTRRITDTLKHDFEAKPPESLEFNLSPSRESSTRLHCGGQTNRRVSKSSAEKNYSVLHLKIKCRMSLGIGHTMKLHWK